MSLVYPQRASGICVKNTIINHYPSTWNVINLRPIALHRKAIRNYMFSKTIVYYINLNHLLSIYAWFSCAPLCSSWLHSAIHPYCSELPHWHLGKSAYVLTRAKRSNPLGYVYICAVFYVNKLQQNAKPVHNAWCRLFSCTNLYTKKLTWKWLWSSIHYYDVIMTTMTSQITSLPVENSTVYSDADQRKHQSSASLVFVWGIHRDRWIPRTKGQLRGKRFHLMTSSCCWNVFNKGH